MTISTPVQARPSSILLVIAGAVPGAAARGALDQAFPPSSPGFPWATFAVNLTGAFILGWLLEALVRPERDVRWRTRVRLVGGTGFCGAFTTYSTFAMESVQLARHGAWITGAVYVVTSVVGGLITAAAGIAAAARKRRGEA